MKKIFLLLAVTVFSQISKATHITNGFAEYTFLGTTTTGDLRYKVSFVLYRDCMASAAPFDDSIITGIYLPNRSLLKTIIIYKTSEVPVKPQVADSTIQLNFCYRQARYETDIILSASNAYYTITFERCCRPTLQNIVSGFNDIGNTFYATIPTARPNNAARIISAIPVFAGTSQTTNISVGCNDIDGHTLKYRFVKAVLGANSSNPIPPPASTLPATFPAGTYRSGFDEKNIFGSAPSGITLDSLTGLVTFTATTQGRYLLAFEVEEWDGNTFIGKNYFEQMVFAISMDQKSVNKVSIASAASDIVQKRIFISWIHSVRPKVNEFTVERRTDFDPNWTTIVSPGYVSLTYTDTAVGFDTTYWYRVSAHTDSGVFVSNITKSTIYKNTFPVAVEEIQDHQIHLYPNPANGIITIETNETVSTMQLIDVRGRATNIQPVGNTIDISGLPAGIYYLEIKSRGNIYREKVIVNSN